MTNKTEIKLKTIVSGSRNFNDFPLLEKELLNQNISLIISGLARGADLLGLKFAKKHNVSYLEFPANWDKYGKSAGYKRNYEMLSEAEQLIAFWDGQSKGTKHMIDISSKKGIKVKIIKV